MEIITGKNAVYEAVKSDREIECIYIEDDSKAYSHIKAVAKQKNVTVKVANKNKLNKLSNNKGEGVVAIISDYSYSEIEDLLESDFLVILDGIVDPHNFGAIIRSVNCVGAGGIIISKRNQVGVTDTVVRSSAGSVMHTKIAKVTNIVNSIQLLKDNGFWIYGTDMNHDDLFIEQSFKTGKVAVVIGSEGKGISRLIKESCDKLVSIPIMGDVDSLNASVAAGIVLYEVYKRRNYEK